MTNGHTAAHPDRAIGDGRRFAVLGLLGLAAMLVLAAGVSALWPGAAAGERWFRAGNVEDFPPGTMTTFQLQDAPAVGLKLIHVARLEDGRILVISGTDPHPRGCDLYWRPDFWFAGTKGWFRDPCLGSTYDEQGRRVFGPAPRDLERLAFEVTDDGTLRIDISTAIPPPLMGWP